MNHYVLDTSVVVKWFSEYDEDDLDKALRLRNEILKRISSATVPDLIFYELANALRYNPRFLVEDVKNAVDSVINMEFDVKEIEVDIIKSAIEIGFKFNVTLYDSYFLALSQAENMPFVTADYRFADRIKGFKNLIRLREI